MGRNKKRLTVIYKGMLPGPQNTGLTHLSFNLSIPVITGVHNVPCRISKNITSEIRWINRNLL